MRFAGNIMPPRLFLIHIMNKLFFFYGCLVTHRKFARVEERLLSGLSIEKVDRDLKHNLSMKYDMLRLLTFNQTHKKLDETVDTTPMIAHQV